MLRVALILALATAAHADFGTIEALSESVSLRVGLSQDRLRATAERITIRAKRVGRLLPAGVAFYHEGYDLLLAEPDLFDERGRIKSIEALSPEVSNFQAAVQVVRTVYHEMAHAEWDHFIAGKAGDASDARFRALVEDEIRPWIGENLPSVDNPRLCVMEWQAYFVEALMSRVLSDWHEILTANGVDPITMRVAPECEIHILSNVARGLVGAGDFGRLVPHVLNASVRPFLDEEYGRRMRGQPIYVSNGLLDTIVGGLLRVETSQWTEERGFRDAWWDALWEHVRTHHGFPRTARDLLASMNEKHGSVLLRLREVQESEGRRRMEEGAAEEPETLLGASLED